jgi:hypothetical protein
MKTQILSQRLDSLQQWRDRLSRPGAPGRRPAPVLD